MSTQAPNWAVESLTPADANRVEAFWRRMAQEDQAHALEQAQADAAAAGERLVELESALSNWYYLLAVCCVAGSEVLGYASVVLIPKLDARKGWVWVDELHVLSAVRRQGAAQALLEAIAGIARQHHFFGVRLAVRQGNEPARALPASRLHD